MWYYRRPFDKVSQSYTNIKKDHKRINIPQRMKELQATIQFNAGINLKQSNPRWLPQGIVATLFIDDMVLDQQKFFYNGYSRN